MRKQVPEPIVGGRGFLVGVGPFVQEDLAGLWVGFWGVGRGPEGAGGREDAFQHVVGEADQGAVAAVVEVQGHPHDVGRKRGVVLFGFLPSRAGVLPQAAVVGAAD